MNLFLGFPNQAGYALVKQCGQHGGFVLLMF